MEPIRWWGAPLDLADRTAGQNRWFTPSYFLRQFILEEGISLFGSGRIRGFAGDATVVRLTQRYYTIFRRLSPSHSIDTEVEILRVLGRSIKGMRNIAFGCSRHFR